MTVVAVLVDPPRDGLVLPRLPETSPLSRGEVTDLYRAMVGDALRAVASSGADLLVNYRPDDAIPAAFQGEKTAETEVRALAADALDDADDARFEVQVGSTPAARVGNTVTHLLREEDATAVAVTAGDAPLLARPHVDSTAMKLRSSDVVLGPAGDGRVFYAAFAEPIDFTDAFAAPEVETLTGLARDADLDVDFLAPQPRVETGADLRDAVPVIRARRAAGRRVPALTTALVDDLGLRVVEENGERTLVRDTDSS